ncbi:hypothetical protein BDV96DRAFT_485845 [Lophiotrema nucula]|uniref:CFEM domain-containing protein n=1 Tax=Lophiotrema nucula TaxID=690887 RepID=A0A6A5ZKJ3_9PLEO|nr:hypothetical protein BDV96DRAFT_485845 [Lophiotrema nucula]
MRFSTTAAALFSLLTLTTAQRTFNITSALAPGQWKKYRCLSEDKLIKRLPACLTDCQKNADRSDGCAIDDFACHCINYNVYSDLSSSLNPCAFPPALGGSGTCTLAELGQARPIVSDMCNFFNATLYAGYVGCRLKLSPKKTLKIVASEKTVIVS